MKAGLKFCFKTQQPDEQHEEEAGHEEEGRKQGKIQYRQHSAPEKEKSTTYV